MRKFSYFCSVIIIFSLCSCDRAQSRFDFESSYKLSSDVVYGELIKNEVITENNGNCRFGVASIKVYESFKGKLKAGQIFQVVGIEAHENHIQNSLHLLFMDAFEISKYPGFGQCENLKFTEFRSIPVWCCAIENANDPQFIMYDMLNSEVASKNYLVSASSVFTKLRKWKQKQL